MMKMNLIFAFAILILSAFSRTLVEEDLSKLLNSYNQELEHLEADIKEIKQYNGEDVNVDAMFPIDQILKGQEEYKDAVTQEIQNIEDLQKIIDGETEEMQTEIVEEYFNNQEEKQIEEMKANMSKEEKETYEAIVSLFEKAEQEYEKAEQEYQNYQKLPKEEQKAYEEAKIQAFQEELNNAVKDMEDKMSDDEKKAYEENKKQMKALEEKLNSAFDVAEEKIREYEEMSPEEKEAYNKKVEEEFSAMIEQMFSGMETKEDGKSWEDVKNIRDLFKTADQVEDARQKL